MQIISLPINFDKKLYKLNSFFGILLEFENYKPNDANIIIPEKVRKALNYCDKPYTLGNTKIILDSERSKLTNYLLKVFLNLVIIASIINFRLGKFITGIGNTTFDNSIQAIKFFRNNKPGAIQNDLCLPRSLFAASTSNIFKEKGVIFIGVALPSNSMHAWIIEDNIQPDPLDNMWINFQPVAVIF